jgi:hypothetical protein
MPIIRFLSPVSQPIELMLLMMYPEDEVLRCNAFALNQVGFVFDTADDDENQLLIVRKGDLRAVLDLPPRVAVREDQKERTRKGLIAGHLLSAIYLMERFRMQPSIGRAIFAVQGWTATSTYGDGSRMATSESAIREYWRQFAPVAHFWAALAINQAYPFAPDRAAFTPEHLPTLLEVAAGLHDFAVTFVPTRARPPVPIVDPSVAWAPPVGTARRTLGSGRFPTGLREMLEGYKAPTPHLPSTSTR